MVAFPSEPNNKITRPLYTSFRVIKHVLEEHCKIYAGLDLLNRETDFRFMWGYSKPFDNEKALVQICTENGISIRPTLSQVLRGTKLTIEIRLDGNKQSY